MEEYHSCLILLGIVITLFILYHLHKNYCMPEYFSNYHNLDNYNSKVNFMFSPKKHPSKCPNTRLEGKDKSYLVQDTSNGIQNIKEFNSRDEVDNYLKKKNCPELEYLPFIAKKNDDPTIEYRQECNKKTALNLHNFNNCYNNMSNFDDMRKMIRMYEKEDTQGEYDSEQCMLNKIENQTPGLKYIKEGESINYQPNDIEFLKFSNL
jgi:hypothetical protein